MTDQVVQSDDPLAGYLHDVGISESDWGIEPSEKNDCEELGEEEGESDDNHDDFVPSISPLDLAKRMQGRFLQKFKITDTRESRRSRFCVLLRSALQHKVMPRENNQFLERFRYILVSSQLLNSNQLIRSRKRPIDQQIAFDSRHGVWKLISVKTRYWTGSGACIVVIVLLLGWGVNKGRYLLADGEVDADNIKSMAVLVSALCIGLFLFAHAQRTKIRMIRTYTIVWANRFIYNCQLLDYEISQALKFIQEVEVVARGYQYSSGLAPMYRLEERALVRHCNRLRSTICSALNLVIPRIGNAITLTENYVNQAQLERYLDMYNVSDVSVARTIFSKGDESQEPSDKDLSYGQIQERFRQLRLIRQMFMCQLMAINSDGDTKDHEKWTSTVDLLHSLSDLCGEMAKSIQQTTENEILARSNGEKINQVVVEEKTCCEKAATNGSHRELVDELAIPLRNLEARVHLLGQTARDYSGARQDAGGGFLQQYKAVGKAIESVLGEWERGMNKLEDHHDEEDSSVYQESPSLISGVSGFTVGSNSELATPCGSSSGGGGAGNNDYTSMIHTFSPIGQEGFASRLAAVDSELQAQQGSLTSPISRFSALASAAASVGHQQQQQRGDQGLGIEIPNHPKNNNSNRKPTMKFAGHRLSKQDINSCKAATMAELAKLLSGTASTP